jgi:hypothetical protein
VVLYECYFYLSRRPIDSQFLSQKQNLPFQIASRIHVIAYALLLPNGGNLSKQQAVVIARGVRMPAIAAEELM